MRITERRERIALTPSAGLSFLMALFSLCHPIKRQRRNGSAALEIHENRSIPKKQQALDMLQGPANWLTFPPASQFPQTFQRELLFKPK